MTLPFHRPVFICSLRIRGDGEEASFADRPDLAPTRQPAAQVGSVGEELKSQYGPGRPCAVGERGGGTGVPLQDLLFHLKFQNSRHTLGLVHLIPDAFWCVHTPPSPAVLTLPANAWGLGFLLPVSDISDFIPFPFLYPELSVARLALLGKKVQGGAYTMHCSFICSTCMSSV